MSKKVESKIKKAVSKSNTRYVPEEFNLNLGTIVRQQLHDRGKKHLDLARILNITTVGIKIPAIDIKEATITFMWHLDYKQRLISKCFYVSR